MSDWQEATFMPDREEVGRIWRSIPDGQLFATMYHRSSKTGLLRLDLPTPMTHASTANVGEKP